MTYRKVIGRQLKKARKEAKISMRSLAKAADVSTSTICNIENARIKYLPQKATLQKLAKCLGKPASYFKRPEKEETFDLSDLYKTLANTANLNEEQKALIKDFTRWVVQRARKDSAA